MWIVYRIAALLSWLASRGPIAEDRPDVIRTWIHHPSPVPADTDTLEIIDPTGEVLHIGAEELTARDLAPLPALSPEEKAKILEDTGAWDMTEFRREVMDEEPTGTVEVWKYDELGAWNPDAEDWCEPALFREVARDALATGALHPPIRESEFVDAVMERVLSYA